MKKLQLNKEVIAQLGNREMIRIEGGTGYTEDGNCAPTLNDIVCPYSYFCTGNQTGKDTDGYDPQATACDQWWPCPESCVEC